MKAVVSGAALMSTSTSTSTSPPIELQHSCSRPWIETPLVESAALSRLAGCRIFLKLENIQPSGSFKSRAMGHQILSHLAALAVNPATAGRRVHFFASSGGNAGLAAVCAAQSLGYPCTVVVPTSTKPLMVEKLRAAGAADVIQHGETFSEAGEYMRDVVMRANHNSISDETTVKVALHPFDKESIWQGNSTIIDELSRQLPAVTCADADGDEHGQLYHERAIPADAIICSVGGGGLLNGLIMGLERLGQRNQVLQNQGKNGPLSTPGDSHKRPNDIHLLAVETAGTDSLALALAQNALVSLPKITSQATSLGAVQVSKKTFQYATAPPPGIQVHSAVLSDAEAAKGVLKLADTEHLLVELACGVCVEAAIGEDVDSAGAARAEWRGRKRKRDADSSAAGSDRSLLRDEGYGDDRSSGSSTETEEEGTGVGIELSLKTKPDTSPEAPLAAPSNFSSKLRQFVPDLGPQSRVVLIVCGGSNITIEMAADWRAKLKQGWK